jgi:hypothetical protein
MEATRRRPVHLRRERQHRPALRLRHQHLRPLDGVPDAVACGRDGGLVLGPFEDAREAMAAADEYAAGHLSDEDRLPG